MSRRSWRGRHKRGAKPNLPETRVNVRVQDVCHWLTRCRNIRKPADGDLPRRDTVAKDDEPLREIVLDLVAIRLSSGLLINEKKRTRGCSPSRSSVTERRTRPTKEARSHTRVQPKRFENLSQVTCGCVVSTCLCSATLRCAHLTLNE